MAIAGSRPKGSFDQFLATHVQVQLDVVLGSRVDFFADEDSGASIRPLPPPPLPPPFCPFQVHVFIPPHALTHHGITSRRSASSRSSCLRFSANCLLLAERTSPNKSTRPRRAAAAHVAGARGVELRHVGEQFRVHNDLRVGIDFPQLLHQSQVVRSLSTVFGSVLMMISALPTPACTSVSRWLTSP